MQSVVLIGQAGGTTSLLLNLVPIAAIVLIFWFLVIRPERKKHQQRQEYLDALKVGEKVFTEGGLLGKVKEVQDKIITLQIRGGNRIDVLRSKIRGPQSQLEDEDTEDEQNSEDN